MLKLTLLFTLLTTQSLFAEKLEENQALRRLVCLTSAASPVQDAPPEFNCPGQSRRGGAKFEQSPAAEPVGIRALKSLIRKIRYELFGPVVVNRSSVIQPCGDQASTTPLDLEYKPGDQQKCMAALWIDLKESVPGHIPMTNLFHCQRFFSGEESRNSLRLYVEEEGIDLGQDISHTLNCPNAIIEV